MVLGALSLPPFITPAALEELLAWPASHLRKFRETVARSPSVVWTGDDGTQEGFYKALFDLLNGPDGLITCERTVRNFDRRSRGVIGKVSGRAIEAAKVAGVLAS